MKEIIKGKMDRLISCTCDICGKKYNIPKDTLQYQEMIHIDHTCGYGSIVEDGKHIKLDICQDCWVDMLKDKGFKL